MTSFWVPLNRKTDMSNQGELPKHTPWQFGDCYRLWGMLLYLFPFAASHKELQTAVLSFFVNANGRNCVEGLLRPRFGGLSVRGNFRHFQVHCSKSGHCPHTVVVVNLNLGEIWRRLSRYCVFFSNCTHTYNIYIYVYM